MGKILIPTIMYIVAILPKIIPSVIVTAEVVSALLTGRQPRLNEDMCQVTIITLVITCVFLTYLAIVFRMERNEARQKVAALKSFDKEE
ncbi:hypothetical protein [Candidatus Uabimicrobium amorphum]|uniref:Uncharacterized protein n=1 Tax=Uabimicrobium amorphum TaxID=2596890 RepID=A0A5S9F1W8_UABAM|nr:hypothetical protein [Candidatus Uabimicrobium amorphum]BBM82503.1 hypothetical protein UABAM_00846 [Candidatus Uabimicrobium amorphum]